MMPLAKAEDKELALDYVTLLKKNGIVGELKASGAIGKRRETLIFVSEDDFERAYDLILEKLSEAGFYCEEPAREYYDVDDDDEDVESKEPNQAA